MAFGNLKSGKSPDVIRQVAVDRHAVPQVLFGVGPAPGAGEPGPFLPFDRHDETGDALQEHLSGKSDGVYGDEAMAGTCRASRGTEKRTGVDTRYGLGQARCHDLDQKAHAEPLLAAGRHHAALQR